MIVKSAAIDGSISAKVPRTVTIEKPSIKCLVVSERCTFMSALPRPQAFVNTRVGIGSCFLRGQFLLQTLHTRAEAVSPRAAFWLRRFQAGLSGIGRVVRGPPLRVQATFRILSFFPLPCWTLSHMPPSKVVPLPILGQLESSDRGSLHQTRLRIP